MVRRTLAVYRNVPAVVVEPLEATLTPHLDTGLQLNLLQFRRHVRQDKDKWQPYTFRSYAPESADPKRHSHCHPVVCQSFGFRSRITSDTRNMQ